MNEINKDKILKFLNKNNDLINLKDISRKTGLSYPTVLKYVEMLNLEGKITIKDYGNVRLVGVKL